MTTHDHKELAIETKELIDLMWQAACQFPRTSKESKKLNKCIWYLNEVREVMDAAAYREHRGDCGYYG